MTRYFQTISFYPSATGRLPFVCFAATSFNNEIKQIKMTILYAFILNFEGICMTLSSSLFCLKTKIDEPLIISVVLYAQLGDLFVSFTYKSPKIIKKKPSDNEVNYKM